LGETIKNARPYAWLGVIGAVLLLVCSTLLGYLSSPAEAAKGAHARRSLSAWGDDLQGDQTRTILADKVGDRIRVDGRYIEFNVRSRDFAVLNYKHTGVDSPDASKNLPVGSDGTTIFESKVPLHGKTLTSPVSLKLGNEAVVLERSGGGQDMKIQAKYCQQGRLFQMEPELNKGEEHPGSGLQLHLSAPREQRLYFTNGRFSGYDSPELATLLSHTERVPPGGSGPAGA
jgi:hypothetical protein